MTAKNFDDWLSEHSADLGPVFPLGPGDRLLQLDFTGQNPQLTADILENTDRFIGYINGTLEAAGARYGFGGYNEHRTIYSRSHVFDDPSGAEPRRLHLGVDIWGRPYMKVMAPLDGIVHSFAFNNAFGDYGATIILSHQLDGRSFYTLYGHLSLNSIQNLHEGDVVRKGDVFAQTGIPFENGHWPPHLHFQLVLDMQGRKGDYPGVCRFSEREEYLANSPDPEPILKLKTVNR